MTENNNVDNDLVLDSGTVLLTSDNGYSEIIDRWHDVVCKIVWLNTEDSAIRGQFNLSSDASISFNDEERGEFDPPVFGALSGGMVQFGGNIDLSSYNDNGCYIIMSDTNYSVAEGGNFTIKDYLPPSAPL